MTGLSPVAGPGPGPATAHKSLRKSSLLSLFLGRDPHDGELNTRDRSQTISASEQGLQRSDGSLVPRTETDTISSTLVQANAMAPFDADKYGNPYAARRSKPHALGTAAVQDANEEDEARGTFRQTSDSSNIISTSYGSLGNSNRPTDQNSPSPQDHEGPSASSVIQIPGFDKTKYGAPRKASLNTTSPADSVRDPDQVSSPSLHTKAENQFAPSELTSTATIMPRMKGTTEAIPPPHYPHVITASDIPSGQTPTPDSKMNPVPDLVRKQWENRTGTVTPASARDQIPKHDNKPLSEQSIDDPNETPEQKLERVQVSALKEIRYRKRQKAGTETTSLRDLGIARRRVSSKSFPKHVQDVNPAAPIIPSQSLSVPNTEQSSSQMAMSADRVVSQYGAPVHGSTRDSEAGFATHQGQPTELKMPEQATNLPDWTVHTPKQASPGQVLSSMERKQHWKSESDQSIPDHARDVPPSRNPRWATAAEIKPEDVSMNSDAFGSANAMDASTDSQDSMKAIHCGQLFKSRGVDIPESKLVGWDGKMQPPPVDWNDRPRFVNNTPDFRNGFNNWTTTVAQLRVPPKDSRHDSINLSFVTIPPEKVLDLNLHPDGIDMVPRRFGLNAQNALDYGYHPMGILETTRDCQPLTMEELTMELRVDQNDSVNAPILDETTEDLVQTWLSHMYVKKAPSTQQVPATSLAQAKEKYKPLPNPNKPKLNIYLRPAVKTDLPQITDIYNWHIEFGCRPPELSPIPESDMRCRFDMVRSDKLPFIVAVERNKKGGDEYEVNEGNNTGLGQSNHSIRNSSNNNNKLRSTLREEKIIGWACAQAFTSIDYTERISVEAEMYVEAASRRKGVGRCLMDKLLEACDRGYSKKGGYQFHCASEIAHLYSPGGGRDLHKVVFLVRNWTFPRKTTQGGRRFNMWSSDESMEPEDDYDKWLKPWLESWNFELEGLLKEVGSRSRRFVNNAYFTYTTKWMPGEGNIPDPLP